MSATRRLFRRLAFGLGMSLIAALLVAGTAAAAKDHIFELSDPRAKDGSLTRDQLRDYDLGKARPVRLPGVVPANVKK